ncbi:tetraacyldisaccharide 4'-kinase [Indioceanicola profundi]|uniref:tetraacyldisaccharide 4'-kinase n=1 Tax=Indioceanicola profundi TaxID=2220096 RepID=UPI000E6AD680|nr:tetraacyldisaccharide 4'-kinase [Indioceanicola profundi]
MKAPAFWQRQPGLAAALLSPAAALWTGITRRRLRAGPACRAVVPVICVGNLVAGGAGKTPVVQALLCRLEVRGVRPAALSRGHGGRLAGPVRVDPARHGAWDVGDEPLLLAAGGAPCWVARDRAMGAEAAVRAGAEVIVLDDGFQNPSLAKDLSLIVADGAAGFGNGRVIPAGPLREPLADGLERAQAVVIIGQDRAGVRALIGGRLPVLTARLVPDMAVSADLVGRRVLAFAGIGRPAKFFDTLAEMGAHVAEAVSFADHHPYSDAEVERLVARARKLDAVPVTTAKDAMRLGSRHREMVRVLPVTLAFNDMAALDALLDPLFSAHGQT